MAGAFLKPQCNLKTYLIVRSESSELIELKGRWHQLHVGETGTDGEEESLAATWILKNNFFPNFKTVLLLYYA